MSDLDIKLANFQVDGIDLNKTELLKIYDELFNIEPMVQEVLNKELNPLKKEANIYITEMQKTLAKIKKVIQLYQKKKEILQNFIQQSDNMNAVDYAINFNQLKQEDILNTQRELIILTDLFTVHIQNILGKNMELIYVYQSKAANSVQVYKINKIEDILKLRTTSKGGIETRLSATKKLLQKNAELIPKEQYAIGESQANLLDITYKEIIRRYNTYRYGYMSLVLWNMKSKPKWHGMRLYQRGDLAEAYSNFVFNRQADFLGNVNSPPETDIQAFMTLVQEVDATFGGVQGDISSKEKNTEYAIKTLSASPQQILATIELAKDLMTGDININNWEQYKTKWKKTGRNTILTFTEDTVKEELNSLRANLTK